MDLSRAFSRHPIFRVLRREDEPAIRALLEASPMRVGGIDLVSDRGPELRTQLDYLALRHLTTVADVDGKIRGFGTFSWGRRYVGGRDATVMYVGDFRVRRDRRVAAGWRACYPKLLDIFATDVTFGPCEWVHTAILRDNTAARRSLAENRPRDGFRYRRVAEGAMVNLFVGWPWRRRRRPASGARVVRGDVVGEKALREFLDQANRALLFGYPFDDSPGNEWDRRKSAWPGFELGRFLVRLGTEGEIDACTLPWSPGAAKRLRIAKIDGKWAIILGAMRALGLRVPRVGSAFDTLYLTHLCFRDGLESGARAEALADLLESVFELPQARDAAMISYADYSGLRREPALWTPLSQATPVEIFAVSREGDDALPPPGAGIGFEMALA